MPFDQVTIGGFPDGGLVDDKKPLFLNDNAFTSLQNAYVWRYRVKKRDGLVGMGRLRRNFNNVALGNTGGGGNIPRVLRTVFSLEPYSQIVPGTVVATVGGTITYTDNGQGVLVSSGIGTGTINYTTTAISILGSTPVTAVTISFSYYPGLPSMGICKQDIALVGIDNTIFFDTVYAYQYTGGLFQELVSATPTTWTGSEKEFFWYANYQGADPSIRYFFATNNNIDDPIRYYTNTTWTPLTPLIADNPPSAAARSLFQALIVIPYYGRLLALNTWEGLTADGAVAASNFFARCRFSQIGDPTSVDAWRSDQFGKGGFLDAPTNESIVSAAFFRNTLIVFFEFSTWQLRYIGEYGLPFIFERISSDFGCVSTYSSIVFDGGVLTVTDRGITTSSAAGVRRIDELIPETLFSFEVDNQAPNFVHGARDFEKEISYWNYIDRSNSSSNQEWPNTTLVYNYKNNTWAKFRDTITCFGPVQFQFGITWDSTTVLWDDEDVTWDSGDDQQDTTYTAAGNQQGYIFVYENQEASTPIVSRTQYAASLFIFAIDPTLNPAQLTVPNHNLRNGEIVYLTGTLWLATDPNINNVLYNISVVDENTITLGRWNGTGYASVSINPSRVYIGGGELALMPRMNLVGKDFNPYQTQGKQFKISHIDFQIDSDESVVSIPALTVQMFVNSYLGEQANIGGRQELLVNSSLTSNFIRRTNRANPCQVTCDNHSLTTGQVIRIADIIGMTQLNSSVSGLNYTITVTDADHFTLNGIDSTAFNTYTSGGIFNVLPTLGTVYQTGSSYAWFRFYSNQYGQYLRVAITYDEELMNQLQTHQSSFELNAINLFFRPGGRLVN